jgi:protein-disulfide isomerase
MGLVAAAIVAVAVIAGSAIIANGLSRVTAQLDRTTGALNEMKTSLAQGIARAPTPPQPVRRGPDPSQRYTLNTKGAPALGPETAKIKIVEFSDFQ